jgi:hypothetical protein
MSEENLIIYKEHEKFIREVCKTETVWALEKEDGFATSTSLNYEDDNDEPVEVLCFWSEKALADSCAKDDWNGYKPVEIPLADFIENWCIGMANDLIMAGTNFDADLFGHEVDPLELIIELSEELSKQNKEIKLQNHTSFNDFVNEVNKILEE